MKNEQLVHKAELLKKQLEDKRTEIKELLGKYETYETAEDEIIRSLSALSGVKDELRDMDELLDKNLVIATFFPLNLPLYSLILFAVIPGLYSKRVFIRAPEIMQSLIHDLSLLMSLESLMPGLVIKNVNRSTFINIYTRPADVILFTGRYENALHIQKACPDSLMICNGGGVNPAIVFPDADVALAAKKIFEMRTFNSGQDCAGTDAIFVHENVYEEFVERLRSYIASLKIGLYGDSSIQIGPILKREYVDDLDLFLNKEKDYIIYNGKIDSDNSLVTPYIIKKSITDHKDGFHEFFAPIFYILTFKNSEELENVLLRPLIQDYSMYISYFGNDQIIQKITKARLLHNQIINDVEQGNQEYGGYGEKANFVAFGNTVVGRPILISREIHNFYLNDGISPLQTMTDGNVQQFEPILDKDLVGSM